LAEEGTLQQGLRPAAPEGPGGRRVQSSTASRERGMHEGEGAGSGERPVALLALEPTHRRRALEDVLVDAGFDVRHAPRDEGRDAGEGVGEAASGGLSVPAAAGPGALVLLAGVPRPDDSTPAAVAALRAAGWDHVVVVGGDVRPTAVARALGRGARGFLVAAPGPPDLSADPAPVTRAVPVIDVGGQERTLSAREVQVLALAADGLSNPEIARELGLSALTVKSHLARMTRRLGARDRAHLVLLALRAGVIA
jgi:DNA-binding NarL/FixJ family response regulator